MQVQQGFADVNGTRLYYEVAGDGEAVVFVHGHTLDTRMWDDQFARFAAHYHVLRYDVRGYGRSSSPPEQPYSHSDDLKALLTLFDMEPATLVGLSMGGLIVVDFALMYPEAIRALVPVDAALIGWTHSEELDTSMSAIRTAAQTEGIPAAKALWLDHALFAPAREKPDVAARLAEMLADYDGWRWLHADPRRVSEPPAAHQLDRIAVPTLVIVGERDLDDFHGIANLLEREIAGAQKVVMPGVGHMANMEAPEQFNDILLRFLATT